MAEEPKPQKPETILPSGTERFQQVLTILKAASPTSNARKALEQVVNALADVERPYLEAGTLKQEKSMTAFSLGQMLRTRRHQGILMHFYVYRRHVFLISETGAYEIRTCTVGEPDISLKIRDNPSLVREGGMDIEISKPDPDGRNIWGEPIS